MLVVVFVVLVALALVSVLVNRADDHGPGPSSRPDHRVGVGRDGLTTATVRIETGADRIQVTTADLGGQLAVVNTPPAGALAPALHLDHGVLSVTAGNDPAGDAGVPGEIDVRIAQGVRWDVVLDQGAKQIGLDLRAGPLHSVTLNGGADQADLRLPAPDGADAPAVTHIVAGLGRASVHVPDGLPVQVEFAAGAGTAVLDGRTTSGIAADTVLTVGSGRILPANGLRIDATGGIGTFTLDRLDR